MAKRRRDLDTCPRTRSRWRRRLLDSVSAIGRTRIAIDQVAARKQLRGKEAETQCARCSGRRPARSLALCAIGGPSPTVTGGAARAVHCWASRASLLEAGDHLPAYRPGLTQVFHIARARIYASSNSVHRRRAPPPYLWRRAMAHGWLSQARRTRCCLPPHALGSPPQAIDESCRWACALMDGRPISATARLHNGPIRRKASALSSRSRRQPLPCRVNLPLDHVESRMRRRSVGRPSHGRCSFNDGRTADPPVFPQGNPGTSAGQLSSARAVVRGQPVDQPGSCQVVCT